MKKVGIWIDHRRALIVTLEEGNESREVVESDIDQLATPEGSRRNPTPYGPQMTSVEHKMEGRELKHLHQYYQDIIKRIGAPERLLVIGPALAKQELAAEIANESALRKTMVKVEPCDSMTDNQVAARIRATDF
ncbi:MAG TPA: hypothetical protein VF247_11625 [Candidatus Krumholzibacteria bacterium]